MTGSLTPTPRPEFLIRGAWELSSTTTSPAPSLARPIREEDRGATATPPTASAALANTAPLSGDEAVAKEP